VLVSIREYARQRGVSHTAIQRRIARGRITLVDGQIDPDVADAQWEQNRDALQHARGAHSRGRAPAAPPAKSAPTPAAVRPVAAPVRAQQPSATVGRQPGPTASGPSSAVGRLPEIQAAREAVKLQKEKLLYEKLNGTLVDAEQVAAETEARFRADAEALLNWPALIAPEFAAELGVDERQIHALLDKYVRAFMRDRSMVAVDTDRGGARA